eukprot:6697439-Alexandrium_andersonii.AAC.1
MVCDALMGCVRRVFLRHGQGFDVHTPLCLQLGVDASMSIRALATSDPFRLPQGLKKAEWAAKLAAEAEGVFMGCQEAMHSALSEDDMTGFWQVWNRAL